MHLQPIGLVREPLIRLMSFLGHLLLLLLQLPVLLLLLRLLLLCLLYTTTTTTTTTTTISLMNECVHRTAAGNLQLKPLQTPHLSLETLTKDINACDSSVGMKLEE